MTKKKIRKNVDKAVSERKNSRYFESELLQLSAVALLALVLRIQAVIAASALPFFKHPVVDAFEYHARALAIAGGELFPPKIPTDPPLYSYVLGLFYAIFGESTAVAYWFNVLAGLAALPPIYLIGRKLAGKNAGLIAALAYALYRPAIAFSAEVLTPSLMIAVTAWLLYFFIEDKWSKWQAPLAGLLSGLAILIRGNALFFAPLGMLWLLLRKGRPDKKAWLATAIYLGTVIAVLGPQVIVNNMIDPPAPAVQDFGGLNIYLGNRHGGNGLALSHPGVSGNLLIDAPRHAGIYRFAARNSFFIDEAEKFWSEYPAEALATTFKKVVYLLNSYEYGTGVNQRWYAAENILLQINPVTFLIILPLALYGLFLLFRRRQFMLAGPLLLWLAAIAGSMVVGTVAARYRIALLPALLPPAGVALWDLAEKIRAKRWRELVPALVILSAGLIVAGPDWFGYSQNLSTDENIARAESARNAGNFALAEIHVTRYLQQHPNDVDARYLRGIYRTSAGDLTGAMHDLQFVANTEPRFSRVWHDIAVVHLKNDGPSLAVAAYLRGIEQDPNNVVLLNESARLLVSANRPGQALANMKKAVALDNSAELLLNLAQAEAAAGRPKDARATLKKALDRVHGSGRVAKATRDLASKWNID